MKVVTPSEMSRIERLAIQDGSSGPAFMEQAGQGVASVVHTFVEKHQLARKVLLLCGRGNNAGDTYVAGIILLKKGYQVAVLQMEPDQSCSRLCQEHRSTFLERGDSISADQPFSEYSVIIDGLFGTGFHGSLQEPYASVVKKANRSGKPIIAVDIPSGLNGETGEEVGEAIHAAVTVGLQFPKSGFFLLNAWNTVGKLTLKEFGLPQQYIDQTQAIMQMITASEAKQLLPTIVAKQHKYQRGYVVGVAGSPGMSGAALLSSESTLRGGAGIYRLLHPEGMEEELSASVYEVIKESYGAEKGSEQILKAMERASAVYIGPGIGRSEATKKILKELLPQLNKPCVLDGDALTLIAEGNLPLPKGAVLTPHEGELMRLMKLNEKPTLDLDFLRSCQAYAEKNQVTLVFKGGPSFIFHPGENFSVNPSGDPGMATAGSGDVLTGLIAALLAHGLPPFDAARLGVYLHGLAGEYAAEEKTSHCMMASDIINHFPDAYKFVEEKK